MVLILVLTSWFWYFSTDERVKRQAITALEQVSGGKVEIDEASLDIMFQIQIKGLRIYPPGERHEDNVVFAANEVILRHDPWSILRRHLILHEIVAKGPKLQVWYDRDRHETNLDFLLQSRPTGTSLNRLPVIYLREGVIEYFEFIDGESTVRFRQNLEGQLFPDAVQQAGNYRFKLYNPGQGVMQSLEGYYDFGLKQLVTSGSFLLERQAFSEQPGRKTAWQEFYELSQPEGVVHTESLLDSATGHNVKLSLTDGSLNLPVADVNIPLHNVQAEITLNNEQITIENIEGDYEDYCRIKAKGVIDGYHSGALFNLEIETTGLNIPAEQWAGVDAAVRAGRQMEPGEYLDLLEPPLKDLLGLVPPLNRETVRNFSPTGEIDLDLQIRRYLEGEEVKTDFIGTLTGHNASVSTKQFPYRGEGFSGKVVITPTRTDIGPLITSGNEPNVYVTGQWVKEEGQDSELNITVDIKNMPVDDKLYQALNPRQQKLWNQFQPQGKVDGVYQSTLKAGRLFSQQLDVTLLDVQGRYEHFRLDATGVKGKARWVDDQVAFSIDEANTAQGNFSMVGSVTNIRDPKPQITGDISFSDFHLNEQFEAVLPARARDFYHRIALSGRAAGRAEFVSPASYIPENYPSLLASGQMDPMDLIDLDITAFLREGRILYDKFPYELNQVIAQVELNNDSLLIRELVGYHDSSQIKLAGTMNRSGAYDLHIQGNPLLFDASLREAFGEQERQFWDKYKPSGLAHVNLELASSAETTDYSYKVAIEPMAMDIELANFKYPFENITGKIVAEPNHIDLHDLVSVKGIQRISLSGEIDRQGPMQDYHLQLQGAAVKFDDQLKDALPVRLQELWRTYEPEGRLDLNLTIDSQQHDDEGGIWNIAGQTSITDGRLKHPMPAEQIFGEIIGQAQYNSATQNIDLTGELHNTSLILKQRSLTNLTGRVDYNSQRQELLFDDISSDFCGGRLAGVLKAGFGEINSGYELKLLFDDVDLSHLVAVEDTEPTNAKQLKGRADGRYFLQKPSGSEKKRGRFSFVVQDAVLGELPIWAQLLYVPNLSLPREGAFNEAMVQGDIVGEKTIFNMIYLRGSAVALDGIGTMTGENHNLQLVFGIDSPHQFPRIPFLSSFYKAIKPGLAQVRVMGTFAQPQVEPIAFPTLDDALKSLSPAADRSSIRR